MRAGVGARVLGATMIVLALGLVPLSAGPSTPAPAHVAASSSSAPSTTEALRVLRVSRSAQSTVTTAPQASAPAAAPRLAAPARIYPLGDSITFGITAKDVVPGGYRGFLDQLLGASGIPHRFVGSRRDNSSASLNAAGQAAHDGWPGFRIDQDARALDGPSDLAHLTAGRWLTGDSTHAAFFPDVVLIHLGTNDIYQRFDAGAVYPTANGRVDYKDAGQRALFVQHLTDRLAALVAKLRTLRPGIRVVVSSIVPFSSNEGGGIPDAITAEYAKSLKAFVAAQPSGSRIVFADARSRFVSTTARGQVVMVPGLLDRDNVHPLAPGYKVMAEVYRDAVTEALRLP